MSRRIRLLAAAALAVAAGALGASPAMGASFQFEPGGTITGTSLGPVTLSGGFSTITCELTLTGTVTSRLVAKRAGTSYGAITSVTISNCSGGTAAVLSLPWPVVYDAILGTLPNAVTGVALTLEGTGFSGTFSGITCLYGGDVESLLAVSGTNPYTTALFDVPSTSVPLVRGSFLCPRSGSMSGTFGISPTQTVTRVE